VALIFVGHDWSEDHHDVVVLDADGERLASARLEEGVEGVAGFHSLIVEFVDDAAEVVVGTETDRGLFVGALVAAGYQVFAINPKAVDRYRDRHRMAGGKSDATDAKVLADLVRTDRHLHRTVAADSERVEGLKVLSRAHKDLIWQRQGQINHLRSACGSTTRPRWWHSALTSRTATRWRCSHWRQHRRKAGGCREPGSQRRFVALDGNATSSAEPARSRLLCAPRSSLLPAC
jgi:Transposase